MVARIVDVVARRPASVDLKSVGVESAADPAEQLFKIGVDREIEATKMDGAKLRRVSGLA